LANDGRAEADADEFVDLRDHVRIEADQLKVSTAMAAFAHHTLGYAMHGNELDIVIFAGFLLL